jgi:hypothetical protein
MKLLNTKRPLSIAVIGMPRSGSTIISSLFNSLDGAFVVGEPHSMVNAPRPFGHDWPAIITTAHGTFNLYPRGDVLEQIQTYGKKYGADIFGFKEVYTINSDPLEIIKHYGSRIDVTFVIFREPRKNYASILANKPDLSLPMSPLTYISQFKSLVDICNPTLNTKIFPISYELLTRNWVRHMYDAIGWSLAGKMELEKYPGTGDAEGRASKKIRTEIYRKPFDGNILRKADVAYNAVLARYPYLRS